MRAPESLVERLDGLVAAGAYESRAAAIIAALERLVTDLEREAIDRAIVDGYTRIPPTADEDAWAEWSTVESVRDEPW